VGAQSLEETGNLPVLLEPHGDLLNFALQPIDRHMGLNPRITSRPFVACALFIVLRLAAHVSAAWFEVSTGVSIWYPPCGLALALLVLLGPRYAPVVFLANLVSVWLFPDFFVWWVPLVLGLYTTGVYTLAAWVTRRYLGPLLLPGDTRQTVIFALIIMIAPAAAALGGHVVFLLQGATSPQHFWSSALNWWVGDMSGLLTIVPVLMVFAAPWLRNESSGFTTHGGRRCAIGITALQSSLLLGSLLLVFAYEPVSRYNPFYLCFIPLIWICFYHGLAGATLATLTITMTGLIGLHLEGSTSPLVIQFLFFELAVACVGLGLGSAVTRRSKVERALVTSEGETRRLLELLEATTDYVVTTDADLRILYANTALLCLTGKVSPAGLRNEPFLQLFPASVAHTLKEEALPVALAKGVWHGEVALLDHAGHAFPVSQVVLTHREGTAAFTFSSILRNISRQKQAEAERLDGERRLLQVQKLESLGVLAGGIAHDFNNLLTPLLGYASLARLDLPEDSPVQSALSKIEQSTERAAALCQQMLAYAGRTPTAFGEIDLSRLIEDTSQLLHVTGGRKRSLELKLAHPLPRITADSGQLRQVLMNLVLNAAEAIGESRGEIVVRTSDIALNGSVDAISFHGHVPAPGHYVMLEVEDNGSGMTPDVQARIFEPFFSTKFAGHGLGLAAVLGIVKAHNGAIQVKSEPGRRTVFRLYFPALSAPARETTAPSLATGPWRGSGMVLIVDDEPEVRSVVARALEVSGFTTRLACDGMEGVEYFREQSHNLRLVMLDLTMPRMDGEQAFHEMYRINPAVPVILMSGYSQKLSLDRFSKARPAAFLSKPFDYKALQTCLRQLPAFKNG